MTDPETGLPADSLAADGTPSVQTSTTNIGAYMWSTVVAERLGIIDHDEAVARLETTLGSLETMERHEPSGQYYNWYDHTTGEVLTVWPPSGDPVTPILSSVDNGWLATGLHVVAQRRPGAVRARRRALREHGLRLLLPAGASTGSRSTSRRARAQFTVLLRHDREREPDRELHRDRQGRDPGEGVLRRLADVPGDLRLELARDPAGRVPQDLSRRQRLRGRLPVRGLPGRPGLGRQHVRGADAGAVRPRGEVGPAQLGDQPPAHGRGADPSRPRRGRVRLLGLLAREHPRRRLHRVRRRRDRDEPRRLQVEQGQDARRPRLRRLPGPRAAARPAAVGVHERRGHAARGVPRPALGAGPRDGEPGQPAGRLRHLRASGASATR